MTSAENQELQFLHFYFNLLGKLKVNWLRGTAIPIDLFTTIQISFGRFTSFRDNLKIKKYWNNLGRQKIFKTFSALVGYIFLVIPNSLTTPALITSI